MPHKNPEERKAWLKRHADYLKKRRIDGLETPQEVVSRRFCQIRKGAKIRHLEFSLTHEDVTRLLGSPCAYGDGSVPAGVGIGVDRKDSRIGYVRGNCVACCVRHNTMKNKFFSYQEMLVLLKAIPSARRCGNRGDF